MIQSDNQLPLDRCTHLCAAVRSIAITTEKTSIEALDFVAELLDRGTHRGVDKPQLRREPRRNLQRTVSYAVRLFCKLQSIAA
jgi:hypothetical protein